ncbi:unnamed protein product, partial [Mesorhabditis spiculigera]
MDLVRLPLETKEVVFSFLDPQSLYLLGTSNKAFFEMVKNYDKKWARVIHDVGAVVIGGGAPRDEREGAKMKITKKSQFDLLLRNARVAELCCDLAQSSGVIAAEYRGGMKVDVLHIERRAQTAKKDRKRKHGPQQRIELSKYIRALAVYQPKTTKFDGRFYYRDWINTEDIRLLCSLRDDLKIKASDFAIKSLVDLRLPQLEVQLEGGQLNALQKLQGVIEKIIEEWRCFKREIVKITFIIEIRHFVENEPIRWHDGGLPAKLGQYRRSDGKLLDVVNDKSSHNMNILRLIAC